MDLEQIVQKRKVNESGVTLFSGRSLVDGSCALGGHQANLSIACRLV